MTDFIRRFPLFASLPDHELEILTASLQNCSFQKGEILLKEGGNSQHFYLIVDGEVEIVKALDTADERILAISAAGSILGEMSMFTKNGTHLASARAHTALTLLKVPFQQFDAILRRNPELAYEMLRLYSHRLQDTEDLTVQDLRAKNLQLTLAYQELQAMQAALIEKEKLEHELQIASQIQCSILPEKLPDDTDFDFGALMISARHIGGDFFDFIPIDAQHLGIVIGDVVDKGVPAALFMALTYSSVRTEAVRHRRPGDTLRAVNHHLLQMNRSGAFVTLLYGILDCKTGELCFARAGHPPLLVFDAQHQPVPVPFDLGQPIGLFDEPALDEACITIPPGGTLLAYSDGLSETVEGQKGLPDLPQLCADILRQDDLDAQGVCKQLWQTVGGVETESLIQDDFTIVAIQHRPSA